MVGIARGRLFKCKGTMMLIKAERSVKGSSLIELALCLPVLVLLVLGTVEICSIMHLKQGLKLAAYEAARIGLVPTATSENVIAQADLLLEGRNIKDYSITTQPSDPTSVGYGDLFTVTVSAASDSNTLFGGWFFSGEPITESVVVRGE